MNYLEVSSLTVCICSIFSAVFVYFNNRRNIVNITWSLMALFIALWSFGFFLSFITMKRTEALLLSRIHNLIAIFIPIMFFHFACSFTGQFKKKKKELIIYYIFIVFYLLMAIAFPTYYINDVRPILSFHFYPKAGLWYYIFPVIFTYFFVYSTVIIFSSTLKANPTQRIKIYYLLVGMIIAMLGGSTTFFLLFDILIPPIGMCLTPLYVIIVTYAILKHRLLNITVIFRWSTFVTASAIGLTTFYLGLVIIGENIVMKYFDINLPEIRMGVIVIISLTLIILYKNIKKILSSILLSREQELEEELNELSTYLLTLLDFTGVLDLLEQELESILRTHCIVVLIYDDLDKDYKIKTSLGYEDEVMHLEVKDDNPVIDQLKSMRKPIVRDWLNEDKKDVIDYLDKLYAEVCVPMIYDDELVGALCFGKRKRRKYTADEIDILMDFAQKIAIALKNAIKHHRLERKYRVTSDFLEICGGKGLIPKDEDET